MALVIKNDMLANFLETKVAIVPGTSTEYTYNGESAIEVIPFEATEEFPNVTVAAIKKPFCNFAVTCGGKGAMTAAQIQDTFTGIDPAIAAVIENEFAVAYNNYIIIPAEASILMVSGADSIFNIMIPEPPLESELPE